MNKTRYTQKKITGHLCFLHSLTEASTCITEANGRPTEVNGRARQITLHAFVNTLKGHPLTHVNVVHVIGRIRPWPPRVGRGRPGGWGCKALGAWADLGASAARPRISNQGASQKYGHNGSGTEANMPVKAPERAWAGLAPPTLMRPEGCKPSGSNT